MQLTTAALKAPTATDQDTKLLSHANFHPATATMLAAKASGCPAAPCPTTVGRCVCTILLSISAEGLRCLHAACPRFGRGPSKSRLACC
jgi:hypothetical protein